ncbi:hypothetical protein J5T34_12095 [Cupriavidus gilardii]|uniref:hypothetical protein n=1 Tax=Cupriavidus gilardii TaxID=82541 RepID=UPI001ABDD29C|nr:hypothetical protein [Cupriavidus gilardii]MBO4121466.1 hypothetical protein [Cupriavidus gilardii]
MTCTLIMGAIGSAAAQTTPATTAAEVVRIDASNAVLVRGPQGQLTELMTGDEARHFGTVNAGDRLKVTHGPARITKLEPLASRNVATAESVDRLSRRLDDGRPGVVREITTTATAEIVAVDPIARTVNFRGPRNTEHAARADDIAIDVAALRPGQMARIVYRETVEITKEGAAR